MRKVARRGHDAAPAYEPPKPSPGKAQQRAQRQPVYRQAVVVLGNGQRLQAALKNVSDSGARVDFFLNVELPEEVLIAEPTLKLRRRARVVWQEDRSAGLQFLPD